MPESVWDLTLDTPVPDYARLESSDGEARAAFRADYEGVLGELGARLEVEEGGWSVELRYTMPLAAYLAWPGGYEERSLIYALESAYPDLVIGDDPDGLAALEAQCQALTEAPPPSRYASWFRALVSRHPHAGGTALRRATPEQMGRLRAEDLEPLFATGHPRVYDAAVRAMPHVRAPTAPRAPRR